MLLLNVMSNLHPFDQAHLIAPENSTVASVFDLYMKITQETMRIYPTMVSVNGKLVEKILLKISDIIEEQDRGASANIYFSFCIPSNLNTYVYHKNNETNNTTPPPVARSLIAEVFAFLNSNFRMDGIALRTKIFLLLLIVYINMRFSGNFNLLLMICFLFWMSALNVVQDHVSRIRDKMMEFVDQVDEMLKRTFFSHLINEDGGEGEPTERQEDNEEPVTIRKRIGIFCEDVSIWIIGFFYSLNPMWSI
eukprot:GAHX01002247.1.p1 GENE.GAHX01002247.1~~GAHX01002247.1.p1  ORF type:complete len:250 (-),score=29.18 GAHX01002247.1:288-1037(-)